MRKYWAYWRNSVYNTFTYRGGLMLWVVGNLMNLLTFTAFWLATNSQSIGGYTRPELISYYIFATLLWWLVGWHCFWWVREMIRDGSISTMALTKPSSYYWQMLFREMGWHTVGGPIGIATAFGLIFLLRNFVSAPPILTNILPLIFALGLATLLVFSLNICVALLTFWFMETESFNHFIWAGIAILGGQSIPISFIPGIWHNIIILLPFRYMASLPLEILFNHLSLSELLTGYLIGLTWLGIMIIAYKFLWQHGTKIYTAVGG